jgi:hypothetical protein
MLDMQEKKYEGLEKALDIETNILSKEIIKDIKEIEIPNDPQKDYDYTRKNLYNLIEKGQEAINGILELAQESEHPRAFEVAGQLIKSVGDVTDKLLDLQKKMKDLDAPSKKGSTTVNNALFVGSTAELSKLLKQGFLNNNIEEGKE